MNSRYLLGVLFLAGVGLSSPASAERMNQNSAKANAAFDACMDSGSAQIESGGVTSCISKDGSGIVCGGTPAAIKKDPKLKGTCDTFRRSGANPWGMTAGERARMNVVTTRAPVRR